jgi:hypothetical protein
VDAPREQKAPSAGVVVDGPLDGPQDTGNRLPLVEQSRRPERAQGDVGVSPEGLGLGLVVEADDAARVAARGRRLPGRPRTDEQQCGQLCEELLQAGVGQTRDVLGGGQTTYDTAFAGASVPLSRPTQYRFCGRFSTAFAARARMHNPIRRPQGLTANRRTGRADEVAADGQRSVLASRSNLFGAISLARTAHL